MSWKRFTLGLLALIAALPLAQATLPIMAGPRAVVEVVDPPPGDTALSDAAATLSSNQSLLFGTIPSGVISSDGAPNTKYGSSAVYDPIRKQIKYLGKRDSVCCQYRLMVYDEADDSWALDSNLPPGASANQNGHGYDHNALDPATGDHYWKPFNSTDVYKWSAGTWSSLPQMATEFDAAALSWFPGLGLIYADCTLIRVYESGPNAWRNIATGLAASQNHTVAEYNPTANVLIFGGGNCDDTAFRKMTSAEVITSIATAPFELGSSENHGVLVSVPNEDTYLGWKKDSANWSLYDISANNWTTVTQSTGSGASPQTGPPNISDFFHCVGTPIYEYDVIAYVCSDSGAGEFWIYKH